MTSLDELRAPDVRYDRLGMPAWPDPHAANGPREHEYSRVNVTVREW